ETEEETRVWYFDQGYQFRAYSSEFKNDSGYPFSKLLLYLFSNDSLTAAYQRVVDDGEVTVVQETKMHKPLGERCGISITYGASAAPGINYLTQADLESKRLASAQALEEVVAFLKANRKKARTEEDDLIFRMKHTKEGNAEDKSKTISYEVEFRMARGLYDGYVAVR
ncbi:MAG TPA: hypothetical protein PLR06_10800, partial [Cyclobacteriaceae bacterium]|nr:hypothetical protein [Cyclobacteriaceae bacterium]